MNILCNRAVVLSVLVLIFAVEPLATRGQQQSNYRSPDNALRVMIVAVGEKGYEQNESRIEVHRSDGRLLYRKSYASADGEHGYGVVQAAWTRNSRFFVFSMDSSGGHQPWHAPTYFYDRRKNVIESLDKLAGSIATPQFVLETPDILITRKYDFTNQINDSGLPLIVKLSRLHKQSRLKVAQRVRVLKTTL